MNGTDMGPLAERLAVALEGSYELQGEIGRGGMGIVYGARDVQLKRRVAIKLLPPDLAFREEIRTRFIREAQTAARLSHPHIVPIHSVGYEGELVYFVMGYVDGESLGARLHRRERLPVEEARRIMKETADALGLAHAVGVIHRDIKPDNILLEGTRRRVMVTDFGIAKARDVGGGTLTGTGVALGTPAYMSPEQALGERDIDARSDIYSLGVVAFETLTGEVPFSAPTLPGILMKQMTEPVPDLIEVRSDCPEELAASIHRCLERNPGDRWPTADALRRALESRSSGPYRPRAALARRPRRVPRRRMRDEEWWQWFEEGRPRRGPRHPSPARREEKPEKPASAITGEPTIVRSFRSNFASYVSVIGGLLVLNVFTGIGEPWVLLPAIVWGIAIGNRYGKLWTAGYSMRDVLNRPPAADALPPAAAAAAPTRLPSAAARAPDTGEYGAHAGPIRQMQKDRAAIVQMVEKLPSSERALLPEVVPTVDALLGRAVELAQTLRQMEGGVDDVAVEQLDQRIADLRQGGAGPDMDRRLELLERQRSTLAELIERRRQVEAQFESCVLAVQNVRFDLLRLRSAGVAAVLDDLTSATQEARALQLDVEAAIQAAGEIRQALGKDLNR